MASARAESHPRVHISARMNRPRKSVGSRPVDSRQYFGSAVMAINVSCWNAKFGAL